MSRPKWHRGLWWIMTLIERNRDPPFWTPPADEHPRRPPPAVTIPGDTHLAFPTLVPVYPDQPNRPLPHDVTSLDLPGYNKYVEIKLYVNRVYPTPVHSTMSSSAWQQRSSGAALRARPEVFACLTEKSETSGGGCFKFIGHFCPRLGCGLFCNSLSTWMALMASAARLVTTGMPQNPRTHPSLVYLGPYSNPHHRRQTNPLEH